MSTNACLLTTTLTLLRIHNACKPRYVVLSKALGKGYGDDTPIPLSRIAVTNGLSDALWCLQATREDFQSIVKPFLRLHYADVLEHLALSKLPEEIKALLGRGVTLLRDPATTDERLRGYAANAANAAKAAYAAAYAAANDATNDAAANDAAAYAAAERAWQKQRFIDRLEGPTP